MTKLRTAFWALGWLYWLSSTVVLVLACIAGEVGGLHFSWSSIFSIGLPLCFINMVVATTIAFFFHRRLAVGMLGLMLISLYWAHNTFAFRIPTEFSMAKQPSHIRLLSWNVQQNGVCLKSDTANPSNSNYRLANILRRYQPDIISMQDFGEYHDSSIYISSIALVKKASGLPYHYYFAGVNQLWQNGASKYGTIIFSKWPIVGIDTAVIETNPYVKELAGLATIQHPTMPFCVANFHLKSMYINPAIPFVRDTAVSLGDTLPLSNAGFIDKVQFFAKVHHKQTRIIQQFLPYQQPLLITGDFNNVPGSYSYNTIKKNYTDVFLAKGSGWGRTYYNYSPTLRIDHVFCSPQWQPIQVTIPNTGNISDHYPIIADLLLTKP
ncbi:MAG: hypothetical protein EAZ47_04290 [Bacteroidetes bacterium]|nr:MAG: hypothetical protein EAY72_08635 [Bacteroidota bacterium]TAE72592.1 MAG: hypothetical protein EAY68_00875 [Bacteroidota bacterium]TAF94237.1 MAG: hypothetical protein EAZ47_04290 [Bacteroidota bacterium]